MQFKLSDKNSVTQIAHISLTWQVMWKLRGFHRGTWTAIPQVLGSWASLCRCVQWWLHLPTCLPHQSTWSLANSRAGSLFSSFFFFSPTSLPFSYWPLIIRIVLLDVKLETQKQIRALKILGKTQSGNGHPDSFQKAYIPFFRST